MSKYIYRPATKDFVISAERMALLLQRMSMTKEKCQEMDDKANKEALKLSRGEIERTNQAKRNRKEESLHHS